MSSSVENAFRAVITKKEEELVDLNDMIEVLENAIRSSPREADKLFIDQAISYCVRLKMERALKAQNLNAYYDEFMASSEDVE